MYPAIFSVCIKTKVVYTKSLHPSSHTPSPCLVTVHSSVVQSTMVEGSIPPGPPSITMSTSLPKRSYIISGSVYSSTISPGSEALRMGLPSSSSICWQMILPGTRRPMVDFLLCIILGTCLLAGNINVKAPGK